jgi:hypothetical protein
MPCQSKTGALQYRQVRHTSFLGATMRAPNCPTCGNQMVFFKGIPRVASLPELCIFKCEECGVTKTQTNEASSIPLPKPNLYLVDPASSLLH